MAKWFRRKKKAGEADSESTGKIGQPKDASKGAALQPSYDDVYAPAPPRAEPAPSAPPEERSSSRSHLHQPHPEEPTRAERSASSGEPRPSGNRTRGGRFRGGRGRGRGRGQGQGQGRSATQIARPAAPAPRVEEETQPESPDAPPASAAHATGQAPRAPRGVVVLAIGLPGSGKTTWFKRRGVTPLSSDMLRSILFDNITEQRYQGLVFSTLRSLLRARLVAKMPWNYVDATNLSPKERKQWIQMARSLGYEVQAVFFDVSLEVCLERNRKRERMVPDDVMHRMAAKLKPPSFEEGFTKIVVVRVKNRTGDAAPAEDAPDDFA